MTSFQITITPKARAAGRFVSQVRRAIQKALAEEQQKSGTTQSHIARMIGVDRSVISREIRGHKDLTLSRVAEIAWALGRKPIFELVEPIADGNHTLISATQTGTVRPDGGNVVTTSGSIEVGEREFEAAA